MSQIIKEVEQVDEGAAKVLKDMEFTDADLSELCYEAMLEIFPGKGPKLLVRRSRVWKIISKNCLCSSCGLKVEKYKSCQQKECLDFGKTYCETCLGDHVCRKVEDSTISKNTTIEPTPVKDVSTKRLHFKYEVMRNRRSKRKLNHAFYSFLGSDKDPEGFLLKRISDKIGYGVFTKKNFEENEDLLEYAGERISKKEALKREKEYEKSGDDYFIFFDIEGKNAKFCIDATKSKQLGRYVNDSPSSYSNAVIKRHSTESGDVFLVLRACKFIKAGTELRYDYNDHVANMPWRLNEENLNPIELRPHQYKSINSSSSEDTDDICLSNTHMLEQMENTCDNIVPVKIARKSPVMVDDLNTVGADINTVGADVSSEKTVENKNAVAYKREKKVCPFCQVVVVNLPRHLQSRSHGYSREQSKLALQDLHARKTYTFTKVYTRKSKFTHKRRNCPIPGCRRIVINLPEHLRKFHRLERDRDYVNLLKSAKPAESLGSGQREPLPSSSHQKVTRQFSPCLDLASEEFPSSPNQQILPSSSNQQTPLQLITSNKKWDDIQSPFLKFLTGAEGGRKEKDSALQIVQDVYRIAKAINAENNLSNLFDAKLMREEYLGNCCKSLRAASVRKYLMSYTYFLTFVIIERIKFNDVLTEDVLNLKLRTTNWRKAYVSEEKEQTLQKKVEIHDHLVTKEQVSCYEQGNIAMNAKSLLESIELKNFVLNQQQYCNVRDHLFTCIHFTNACRSGVTANMMIEEFEAAKELPDGRVVIRVKHHKTRKTYGPANITLSEVHFIWLKTYVQLIRARLPCQDKNVFLAWNGRSLSSGTVSDRMHQLWVKSGVFNGEPQHKLCSNIIRKTASTVLRETGNPHIQQAADAMAHSTSTAENDYFVRKFQKSAVVGSKAITGIFYTPEDLSKSPLTKSSTKKHWTTEELEEIENAFSDFRSVTMEDVRKSSLCKGSTTPKQLYNKIKGLARKHHRPSKKNTRKVIYSPDDVSILRCKCIEMISGVQSVTKPNVDFTLEGEDLLERFTFSQLRTRIQYEKILKKADQENEESSSDVNE